MPTRADWKSAASRARARDGSSDQHQSERGPGALRQLQHSVGNRAAALLIGRTPAATASRARSENASEREAERVADRLIAPDPASAAGVPRVLRGPAAGRAAPPPLPGLGSGRPLPGELRYRFERRLGHDLSAVRLHTGPRAAEATRAVDARAFTYSRHIVFDSGALAPETREGARLLAHELAHVVQQTGGRTGDRDRLEPLTATGPRLARQPRRPGGLGAALRAQLRYDRDRDEVSLVLDPGASLALPVGRHGLFGMRSPTGLRARLGLASGEAEVEPTLVHFGVTGRRLSLGAGTLVAPVLRGTAELPEALRGSFVGQPYPTGGWASLAHYGRIPTVLGSPISELRGSLRATAVGSGRWSYPLSQAWGETLLRGFAEGRLRLDASVDQAAGRFELRARGSARIGLDEVSAQVDDATLGRLPLGSTVRLRLWGNAHLSTDQLPRSLSLADVKLLQLLRATQAEGGGAIHGELSVLGVPGDLHYRFRIDADGISGRAALDFPSRMPLIFGARGRLNFDFRRGLNARLTTWGLVQLASNDVRDQLAVQEARGQIVPPRALQPDPEQPETPGLGYGVGHLHLRPSGQSYLAVGVGFSRRLYLGAFYRRTF